MDNNLANVPQQYNYQNDFLGWIDMVHDIMNQRPDIYGEMTELEKATWALAHSNMLIHSDFMNVFARIAAEQAAQEEKKAEMESTLAPFMEALEEVQKKQSGQASATLTATAQKRQRASVTSINSNK